MRRFNRFRLVSLAMGTSGSDFWDPPYGYPPIYCFSSLKLTGGDFLNVSTVMNLREFYLGPFFHINISPDRGHPVIIYKPFFAGAKHIYRRRIRGPDGLQGDSSVWYIYFVFQLCFRQILPGRWPSNAVVNVY